MFQLFWSNNSIDSEFVRQEWEYALGLRRSTFIRPVYWEEPLPRNPEKGLPPQELARLHFHKFKHLITILDPTAGLDAAKGVKTLAGSVAVFDGFAHLRIPKILRSLCSSAPRLIRTKAAEFSKSKSERNSESNSECILFCHGSC